MGRLVYTTICSLDGYVADASGGFEWAAPDAEVHQFVNDLERGIGTMLCGRRLYEVLRYWDTAPTDDPDSVADDYARVWQEPHDVSIGGPSLAAQALRAGVVDEVSVFRVPHVVGGGTPILPPDVRMDLRLRDSRTFGNGTTYARY